MMSFPVTLKRPRGEAPAPAAVEPTRTQAVVPRMYGWERNLTTSRPGLILHLERSISNP